MKHASYTSQEESYIDSPQEQLDKNVTTQPGQQQAPCLFPVLVKPKPPVYMSKDLSTFLVFCPLPNIC